MSLPSDALDTFWSETNKYDERKKTLEKEQQELRQAVNHLERQLREHREDLGRKAEEVIRLDADFNERGRRYFALPASSIHTSTTPDDGVNVLITGTESHQAVATRAQAVQGNDSPMLDPAVGRAPLTRATSKSVLARANMFDNIQNGIADEIIARRPAIESTPASRPATSSASPLPARFEILDRENHPIAVYGDRRFQYVRCHLRGANATTKHGGIFFGGVPGLGNHYRQVRVRDDGRGWSDEDIWRACRREDVDLEIVRSKHLPSNMVMDFRPDPLRAAPR